MPLIMLSGYPSSGKTIRAQQLKEYFNAKIVELGPLEARIARLKVHLINDEMLGLSREVYRDARPEKDARATFYGAIKRLMSRDDVVIADGMNYIKGYRYQLYCEAKALMTPSCVVQIGAPADKCREWNKAAAEQINQAESKVKEERKPYAEDVLDNLIFRYEEPNGMTRWDSPLFVIPWEDNDVPGQDIWNAMVNAATVRPHQATVMPAAADSNYLQILDKTTQEVVGLILEHQKMNGDSGGVMIVPDASANIELPPSQISLPQLQRIRRQFITMNRQHKYEKGRLRDLFIEYLNGNLN